VGNLVLLAKARTALKIPYVASGGVGTGTQLAACLALGADGVNMGTRFMATKEAPIHDGIKDALVKGNERSTTLVMKSVGNTERVYKNGVAKEVQDIERVNPGKIDAIRHLVSGENYRKSFQESGDPESSVWSCGVVMGLIDDVPTCAELVRRMVADAERVITNRLPSMVHGRSRL
jgi:NADH:quinone reductase (non-electrogenic)